MLFSSPRFFLFLALLLTLVWARIRNAYKLNILALGSCFFYAAWDVRYLGLLLAVSAIDYWCAKQIARSSQARHRRALVLLSVSSNLAILGYFKYANFFLDNLNAATSLAGIELTHLDVLLPAGISFYTFKTMSYTIDVYRRRIEPVRSLLDYTTFVTFFPELIAGPIVRASVFLPQMSRPVGPSRARLSLGGSIFLVGLTKKLVLADRLAAISDPVFANPERYSTATVWLGVLAYSLQIYCDFSGYSDMAIGTAKMFGYDLPENFDMPYLSRNITEFWRRWHITLSTWLRDYLYIPLGGNRHGTNRTYINLMLTMLLGGLWHGASWNFVIWGALHGLALALHRVWQGRVGSAWMPRPLATALTFAFVVLCWIPFRSPTLGVTITILRRLVPVGVDGASWVPSGFFWCGWLVTVGHVIGSLLATESSRWEAWRARTLRFFGATLTNNPISGRHVRLGVSSGPAAALVTLWILGIFFFASTSASPFIYFQF